MSQSLRPRTQPAQAGSGHLFPGGTAVIVSGRMFQDGMPRAGISKVGCGYLGVEREGLVPVEIGKGAQAHLQAVPIHHLEAAEGDSLSLPEADPAESVATPGLRALAGLSHGKPNLLAADHPILRGAATQDTLAALDLPTFQSLVATLRVLMEEPEEALLMAYETTLRNEPDPKRQFLALESLERRTSELADDLRRALAMPAIKAVLADLKQTLPEAVGVNFEHEDRQPEEGEGRLLPALYLGVRDEEMESGIYWADKTGTLFDHDPIQPYRDALQKLGAALVGPRNPEIIILIPEGE